MGPREPVVKVVTTGRLDPGQTLKVIDLVTRATEADQVRPLSEHVALHLRYGGDEPVKTILALIDDRVVGYGHLDVTDKVEGASAELVVDPLFRKRGVGQAMLQRMVAETSPGSIRPRARWPAGWASFALDACGICAARSTQPFRRLCCRPASPYGPSSPAVMTRPG